MRYYKSTFYLLTYLLTQGQLPLRRFAPFIYIFLFLDALVTHVPTKRSADVPFTLNSTSPPGGRAAYCVGVGRVYTLFPTDTHSGAMSILAPWIRRCIKSNSPM